MLLLCLVNPNKDEVGSNVSLVPSPSVTFASHLLVQWQKGEMADAGCPGVRWLISGQKGKNSCQHQPVNWGKRPPKAQWHNLILVGSTTGKMLPKFLQNLGHEGIGRV